MIASLSYKLGLQKVTVKRTRLGCWYKTGHEFMVYWYQIHMLSWPLFLFNLFKSCKNMKNRITNKHPPPQRINICTPHPPSNTHTGIRSSSALLTEASLFPISQWAELKTLISFSSCEPHLILSLSRIQCETGQVSGSAGGLHAMIKTRVSSYPTSCTLSPHCRAGHFPAV